MRGTRILIAEDDLVSSQILSTWLQKWGYNPVVTSDGSNTFRGNYEGGDGNDFTLTVVP